jgi:predicted  nucleic acid-binding Zn-ribbon protein
MSDISCDCGYNYTQTGCPNCKHIPIDYTAEYEQALANMQREYDKRGDRIEELEVERDKYHGLFVFWRAEADKLREQLRATETQLAKAVRLMELSVELATWNTTLLDDVIYFIAELKED